MVCQHCSQTHGHYSNVEFKCPETGKPTNEDYWFCHSCALIVYETDPHYQPQK